jgi:tRNA threonylcarbamoyladenosine biosynthesis protein TsaB
MTTILAIETSTEIASVALFNEDQIFHKILEGVQTHSQGILPAIQDLLVEANLTLNQCDAIAYGCGPGAFTGVRTACGIVQGLAFGLTIPVIPVSSLLAMAHNMKSVGGIGFEFLDFICILDARMGEVYWAHYQLLDGMWSEISAPQLSVIDNVLQYSRHMKINFALASGIDASLFHDHKNVAFIMPRAANIAKLGLADFQNSRFMNAEKAQPLYLRNKIALTSIEREQEKKLKLQA